MTRLALVTGGAGFIGSHVCDSLLQDGWTVRVIDNFSTGVRENLSHDVECIEGDISDADLCAKACGGVDTVFHLAAKVTIRHSVQTFYEDAETNILGTLNLLRAAGDRGVRRFIHTSSMAVYADSADGRTVSEDHTIEPLSPYGISKFTGENYVLMMAPKMGVEPVILRLFNTYGPRQGYTPYVGVTTIFVTRILQGKECVIYGDGAQCRDFVHVSDVAKSFRLAADAAASGGVFNIGTGAGTTVNELAELVRREIGKGEFSYVPVDSTELRHSVANIARAREFLGYEPSVSLGDGLPEVIEAIRKAMPSAR